MDTKLNINSIEAGSITYDKFNQDVVDKFNTKADSASVTNVSNRVTAIEELIATDSDAVIDKWDEVVTFLDGIGVDNDLEAILASKANQSALNATNTTISNLKTDAVGEGSNNLYFTNARARSAITGGASTVTNADLTASRALVSNASGKIAVSDITATELGYLDGVTSAIQTQLNNKAAKSVETTASTNASNISTLQGYFTNGKANTAAAADTATTATKLTTSAGSSSQPVYFSNGVPVSCTLSDVRSWLNFDKKVDLVGSPISTQSDVSFFKICTVNLQNGWADTFFEFDITGRAAAYQKIKCAVVKHNTTNISSAKIYSCGGIGNKFNVRGYHYIDSTNGDYLEIWCDIASWDSVYIRRTLESGYYNDITWNLTRTTEEPIISESIIEIPAEFEKINGYSINASVPAGAKFTDTTYSAGNGLTLSGTTLAVGAGTGISVSADAIGLAASGVTAGTYGPSANVTGSNNATISVPEITVDTYGRVTKVTNRTYTSVNTDTNTNTTYTFAGGTNSFTVTPSGGTAQTVSVTPSISVATTSANGLMSSADKTKLNGIATGATKVTSDTVAGWGFTKNAGTVTSITTGTGLTGGPITETGTISLNSTYQTYCTNGNAAWASYTTATSIASIPVGYKLVKCTISAAGSFALASTSITAGREIHIVIYNSSSSDVVVSLPTASPYVNFNADSLTVPANGYAEINVISDGSNLYIRTLA